MTNAVLIPTGAYLHFYHAFNFENGKDGGVLEYSTDDGGSWQDTSALMAFNGYTSTIVSSSNPLYSRSAVSGDSHG